MRTQVCHVQLLKHNSRQLLIVITGLVTSLPSVLPKDLVTTLNLCSVESSALRVI